MARYPLGIDAATRMARLRAGYQYRWAVGCRTGPIANGIEDIYKSCSIGRGGGGRGTVAVEEKPEARLLKEIAEKLNTIDARSIKAEKMQQTQQP